VTRHHPYTLSSPLAVVLTLFAGSCADLNNVPRHCRGIQPNGPQLFGHVMARMAAPGCPVFEDIQVRFADLKAGVTLANGETVGDATVEASVIKNGTKQPRDFVGATLQAVSERDQPVVLRINEVTPGDDKNGGITQYRLSYAWRDQLDGPAPKFLPLCKDDAAAIAIAGQWDLTVGPGGGGKRSQANTEVTFACPGSAAAKCVTVLEYRPWGTTPSGASLDSLHQSCVRAVRADYCGTGQSNTQKDEKINFYDSAGVQRDAAQWTLEAIWGPDGARCVESTRLDEVAADPRTHRRKIKVQDYIAKTCPQVLHACPKNPLNPAENPALLYTEVAPAAR
jgi:hypothetical protein